MTSPAPGASAAVEARQLVKRYGVVTAVDGVSFSGRARRDLRLPRRQRRRQDDHAAHAVRAARLRRPAPRVIDGIDILKDPLSAKARHGLPRRRAIRPSAPHRARVPQLRRRPVSHAARRAARAEDGAPARPVRAGQPRWRADRRLQPRHAAEDRPGLAADPRALGPVAGRAHQRSRSALGAAGQRPARGAGEPGHHGAAVHAHPRGGPGPVPARRHHRSRTHHRDRDDGRAARAGRAASRQASRSSSSS